MQYTAIFAAVLALAASASAQASYSNSTQPYPINNGTSTGGHAAPSGTASAPSSTSGTAIVPSTGAASRFSAGPVGMIVVVGGVAMTI